MFSLLEGLMVCLYTAGVLLIGMSIGYHWARRPFYRKRDKDTGRFVEGIS